MPSSKDGIMVILSSPSGAGKTTLVNLLSKQNNFEISISHTTRQPRPGEVRNKDYFFVNSYHLDSTYINNFTTPFDTNLLKVDKLKLYLR